MKVHHRSSAILKALVYIAAYFTVALVSSIIGYILITGIPKLKPSLFAFKYTSENCSMFPSIVNTFIMIVLSLLFALPIGIFSALFLTEYAKRGAKYVKLVRMMAETLSGIPSIVYGLFGYIFFNIKLGWGYSLLSGALTLSMMILPLIMRSSEEALIATPDSYREGSYGLGAGKVKTIFSILLPSALPGIFAGVVLAIGRIVGETAALIFTSGTVAGIPKNILGSGRTLAIHMYVLMSEGLHMDEAKGVAVVLLLLVLLLNFASRRLQKGLNKNE